MVQRDRLRRWTNPSWQDHNISELKDWSGRTFHFEVYGLGIVWEGDQISHDISKNQLSILSLFPSMMLLTLHDADSMFIVWTGKSLMPPPAFVVTNATTRCSEQLSGFSLSSLVWCSTTLFFWLVYGDQDIQMIMVCYWQAWPAPYQLSGFVAYTALCKWRTILLQKLTVLL